MKSDYVHRCNILYKENNSNRSFLLHAGSLFQTQLFNFVYLVTWTVKGFTIRKVTSRMHSGDGSPISKYSSIRTIRLRNETFSVNIVGAVVSHRTQGE